MANRPGELQGIILQALATPLGVIVRVAGGDRNKRQLAISALSAAKRELILDHPKALDIQIRAVPGTTDEIAIKHLESFDGE